MHRQRTPSLQVLLTTIATLSAAGCSGGDPTSAGTDAPAYATATGAVVHAGVYVAPAGSSAGDGSATRPLDLKTVLSGARSIRAGDTIWVRGGTYRTGYITTRLAGQSGHPIVVRAYPGERAIIDGGIQINGPDVWFWGLEIGNTNSSVAAVRNQEGFDVLAPRVKLINNVVHDHAGVGVGMWQEAPDAEATGNIIYNNGWYGSDPGSGHGLYGQNSTGAKLLRDNVLFQSSAYGFHMYGESGQLNNITLEGNVSFNNGVQHGGADILVGGAQSVRGLVVRNNYTYMSPSMTGNGAYIGRSGTTNLDAVVQGNIFAAGWPAVRFFNWSKLVFQRNLVVGINQPGSLIDQQGSTSGYQWSGNTWYTSLAARDIVWGGGSYDWTSWRQRTGFADTRGGAKPTGVTVVVRANPYERGRGHVIVYNWSGVASVAANLSAVLRAGDRYQIHHVYDLWGAPIASGTYGGGTVTIPWRTPSVPRGLAGVTPASIGAAFGVFVVTLAN